MPTLSWYHSEEVSWRTPSREAAGQETNLIPLGILWRTDLFQLSWFWGQVGLSLSIWVHLPSPLLIFNKASVDLLAQRESISHRPQVSSSKQSTKRDLLGQTNTYSSGVNRAHLEFFLFSFNKLVLRSRTSEYARYWIGYFNCSSSKLPECWKVFINLCLLPRYRHLPGREWPYVTCTDLKPFSIVGQSLGRP